MQSITFDLYTGHCNLIYTPDIVWSSSFIREAAISSTDKSDWPWYTWNIKQLKVAFKTNNIIFLISSIYIHMYIYFCSRNFIKYSVFLYKLYLRMFQTLKMLWSVSIIVNIEWKTNKTCHTVGTVPKSNPNKKWRG
jgi:hypothetical protein